MKKFYFVMAILVIASMVLAACGTPATEAPVATEMPAMTEAPTDAPVATEAPAMVYKVGQVTDLGGIDDKSFNAGAYAGIEKAIASVFLSFGKFPWKPQSKKDYLK